MDQAEPNLKVTDRRHFTADGKLKSDISDVEVPPPDDATGVSAASEPDTVETPPAVSFSSFVISLATQAAEFIGGEPRNLAAARQVISALEMLKDKSEGRRTAEESRILDAILFDLRLAFVGSAKGPRT